jgi:undecaprenyl pyrophosphate phosphatase UppP
MSLTYPEAIVIGALQGVAELFPVSSLGHSILIPALIGGSWKTDLDITKADSPYLAFVVGLHVATALALMLFFWRDWVRIIGGLFTSIRHRRIETADEKLAWLILVATIPVGIAGLIFDKMLRTTLGAPTPAAIFLTLNGGVILLGERMRRSGRLGAGEVAEATETPRATFREDAFDHEAQPQYGRPAPGRPRQGAHRPYGPGGHDYERQYSPQAPRGPRPGPAPRGYDPRLQRQAPPGGHDPRDPYGDGRGRGGQGRRGPGRYEEPGQYGPGGYDDRSQYGQDQYAQGQYGQDQYGQGQYRQEQYRQGQYGQEPYNAQGQYGRPRPAPYDQRGRDARAPYPQGAQGQPGHDRGDHDGQQYGQGGYGYGAQDQYAQDQYGQDQYAQDQYGRRRPNPQGPARRQPSPARHPDQRGAYQQRYDDRYADQGYDEYDDQGYDDGYGYDDHAPEEVSVAASVGHTDSALNKASDARLARLPWLSGILIGAAQILALFPGISRSGVTMIAGLTKGLSHEDAARFAFLLATPVILAAGVLKLPELFGHEGRGIHGQILVGSLLSFVGAYVSVRFLTKWFETRTLTPFAIYCAVFGLGSLVYLNV